ncbi:MAG: hypothetical protein JSS09_04535 [Verrucomicrobia bacterium]|nr:hypothetical protein [Verrucomicrobiota bacterium]
MRIFVFNIYVLSFASVCLLQADEGINNIEGEKKPSSFPLGGDVSIAFDSFRSLPDGSWGGNMGAYVALNLAMSTSWAGEGTGIQGGWSYGIYDWDGRGSTSSKSLQQEAFFTLGLFHKTPTSSGINAGVCYDWSVNAKAGVFGLDPTMAQVRGQLGYLCKGGNEFGVWSSYGTKTSHKSYSDIPVEFRAVSQVNAFWRHIFKNNGETMIWAGTPYRKGLMFESGRAGSYIVGASFKAPLTYSLSIEGHGMYMGSRGGSAYTESKNYAANVSLALTYSFGGRKTGSRPYLPLANNSNFIADTSISY